MNSKILDGRKLAKSREAKLKKKLSSLKFTPKVVSILIGSDPPSVLYTSMKQKKALEVGIEFEPIEFSVDTPVSEIVKKIYELNKDPKIAGIMIQLPMPKEFLIGLDPKEIIELIDPKKDIDGLTSKRLVPPAAAKASMITPVPGGVGPMTIIALMENVLELVEKYK